MQTHLIVILFLLQVVLHMLTLELLITLILHTTIHTHIHMHQTQLLLLQKSLVRPLLYLATTPPITKDIHIIHTMDTPILPTVHTIPLTITLQVSMP